jgi:hypothetical protein
VLWRLKPSFVLECRALRKLSNLYAARDIPANHVVYTSCVTVTVTLVGGTIMLSKILSGAVLAGVLLSAAAPVTFAADAPKTKEDCAKHKDMSWDAAAGKCVKK